MSAPEGVARLAEAPSPPIELGWVLAGATSASVTGAAQRAIELVSEYLASVLPQFDWRMRLIVRRDVSLTAPVDPMVLVDIGVMERDVARWDFAFVITDAQLLSQDKPFMLGAPAHALDVAVLSTARLDPAVVGSIPVCGGASEPEPRKDVREETLSRRLAALVMHLFGHLNDVPHSDDPSDFLFDVRDEKDLDAMRTMSAASSSELYERLAEVADPRIEEVEQAAGEVRFYLRALWVNRGEVLSGVKRIAPWQFPIRYSRLTTAAASTLLVLIMTAEAWELGMSQPGWRVCLLSALSLFATSYYILVRQHLVGRFGRRRTEQRAVTVAALSAGVVLGMLTTYLLLFALTWLSAKVLFRAELVRAWAASIVTITEAEYLSLAGFIASAGILIGALGASFEQESYFRRVAILDEET